MTHLFTLSLLAVALMMPLALAQGDARIEDAALDAFPPPANGWADIQAASIALVDAQTIRLTMELGILPEIQPGAAYCVIFAEGGAERYGCLAAVPTVTYVRGPWSGDGPGGSFETQGEYAVGPGGSVAIEYPVSALSPEVTRVTGLRAYAVDIKTGAAGLPVGQFLVLDEAQGDVELVVREAPAAEADASATETGDASVEETVASPEVAPGDPPGPPARDTPAGGAFLAIAAALLAARRRR